MKQPEHRDDDPGYTEEDLLLDSDMQQSLREWFSYELPDQVAFAIHRFLYDISALFERAYDDEIRHFMEDNQLHENHLHRVDSINAEQRVEENEQIPWFDDEIEF